MGHGISWSKGDDDGARNQDLGHHVADQTKRRTTMTTPVFDTDEEGRTVLNSTVAENLEAQWSNHIVSEIARQGQFLEEAMQEQIENHLTSMASAAGETITEAVQEKVDWLDEKLHEYVTEYVPDEMINESVGEEIGRLREQNELLHAAIRVLVENVYSGGDVDAFYAAVRAEVGSHVATAASYQDAVI